jgi:hypothetical protein
MARIAAVHVPYFSHINATTRLTGVLSRQGERGHRLGTRALPEENRVRRRQLPGSRAEMPDVDGFMGWVAALAAVTEQCSKELIEQLFAHD